MIGTEFDSVRTLGDLFLRSEHVHDRAFAMRDWQDGAPAELPDWRLHRQVLRAALYLRERADVRAGDEVAVVGSLGSRSFIVEYGAVVLGAAAAIVEPSELADYALVPAPRARTFFDVSASWSDAMDSGRPLDTPERAQSLRIGARAIEPGAPALVYRAGTNGSTMWARLSHEEAVTRVQQLWYSSAWQDEVTLASGSEASLAVRLSLYACVGDGRARVTFRAARSSAAGARDGGG